MQLEWKKCREDQWCSFTRLNLTTVQEQGVYIIWSGGHSPYVVYIGQGDVAKRLHSHRRDEVILRHDQHGPLFVTWASVPVAERDGVENYLAQRYDPHEGRSHPEAGPISVNSPWSY